MAGVKKARIKQRIWEKEEWRRSLYDSFSMMEDWRDNRGKRHRLIDIMIMAVYGIIWGYSDFANMCEELKYHEDYFTGLLGLENGIPSHDCFSAVFRALPPDMFIERFVEWISEITTSRGKHIAIDGKAARAACEKSRGGSIPYILNALLTDSGVLYSQMAIQEKKNEISTIPEFLDMIDLDGSLVTIDAIGAQKAIASKIVGKGGTYVLPVKQNQPTLHDVISGYFATAANDGIQREGSCCKDHGRIERRQAFYSEDVSCISEMEGWETVKAIGRVVRERTVIGKKKDKDGKEEDVYEASMEDECFIISAPIGAASFAVAVRNHWKVESFHWELDMYFGEDRSTARKGSSMENLSLMRKIVRNLMKLDESAAGKTSMARQIYYSHNMDAIERLVFGIIPSEWDRERAGRQA